MNVSIARELHRACATLPRWRLLAYLLQMTVLYALRATVVVAVVTAVRGVAAHALP